MLDSLTKLLGALAPYAWPTIALVLFWRVVPTLERILVERKFRLKVGNFELSAEEAIKSLSKDVEDLLKARLKEPESTPPLSVSTENQEQPASAPKCALWVDDYPQNNAFQIQRLRHLGVKVVPVRSTSEGLERLRIQKFDLVISDMGRSEDGVETPDAGLVLLSKIRELGLDIPIIFYTSSQAVSVYGPDAQKAGARITSSVLQLLQFVEEHLGDLQAGTSRQMSKD